MRRALIARATAVIAVLLAVTVAGCTSPKPAPARPAPPSVFGVESTHSRIVVLVSIDGFRADFLNRYPTPNLHALAARGTRAEWLIPVFPSKTFPNHYSIVTGLYPEHHGIVSNNMEDASIGERFTMSSATAKDPRWWGGEPAWNTAARQGLRAASMFWPGAEAPIGGRHPDYWFPFDKDKPNADRVEQVLKWLAMPTAERPGFITLYFSDVDSAGHDFGLDSNELTDAVARIDGLLGTLVEGIEHQGQTSDVALMVVSDHGMTPVDRSHVIVLDDYIDPSWLSVVDWSPVLMTNAAAGHTADDIVQRLAGKTPHLAVYRKAEMPERYHFRAHPRIPAVLGVADVGWTITTRERFPRLKDLGDHGYDPASESMRALFIAAGSGIRQGAVVAPFENVHIYDLLCTLLGLTPAPNDGDPQVTRPILTN